MISSTNWMGKLNKKIKYIFSYSGSDLNTLVRDASFEPLRKCQRATTFK
jgi:hypothetical protein